MVEAKEDETRRGPDRLEPGVLEGLHGRHALMRIRLQKGRDELFRLLQVLPKYRGPVHLALTRVRVRGEGGRLCLFDGVSQHVSPLVEEGPKRRVHEGVWIVLVGVGEEGREPDQHNVGHHTNGPHIRLGRTLLLFEDLWSNVAESA